MATIDIVVGVDYEPMTRQRLVEENLGKEDVSKANIRDICVALEMVLRIQKAEGLP